MDYFIPDWLYTVYIASIKELVQQGNTSSNEWGLSQTQHQLQNRKLKRKRKKERTEKKEVVS